MQNSWILPKVKYFLSVEAILCQFPNLWFLQLTPRSDLALTARIPQQIRQILKGFSVQWETRQGPQLVLVWQVPRQACTQALRDGGGACRAHTSAWGFREGLFVKALLRMNLGGWTGVDTWKRRETVFWTKKGHHEGKSMAHRRSCTLSHTVESRIAKELKH